MKAELIRAIKIPSVTDGDIIDTLKAGFENDKIYADVRAGAGGAPVVRSPFGRQFRSSHARVSKNVKNKDELVLAQGEASQQLLIIKACLEAAVLHQRTKLVNAFVVHAFDLLAKYPALNETQQGRIANWRELRLVADKNSDFELVLMLDRFAEIDWLRKPSSIRGDESEFIRPLISLGRSLSAIGDSRVNSTSALVFSVDVLHKNLGRVTDLSAKERVVKNQLNNIVTALTVVGSYLTLGHATLTPTLQQRLRLSGGMFLPKGLAQMVEKACETPGIIYEKQSSGTLEKWSTGFSIDFLRMTEADLKALADEIQSIAIKRRDALSFRRDPQTDLLYRRLAPTTP